MSGELAGGEANTEERITIVLVDDHAVWRNGVRSLLEDTEFEVIGEASSGSEAVTVVSQMRPRLVLLDIRMAGGDGLDALQSIKAENPQTMVIMMTTYDNPTYMARAVAGGAAGYLLKGIDPEAMLESLRSVSDGKMLLRAQDLVRSLRGVSENAASARELIEPLTSREEEVLRLLSTGMNNRDIAAVLFVAESTVKTHIEHIISKLGVSDRVQAAVWAARQGIVRPAELS
jgi:DNA-binding NarL/FixJ family response regulator